MADDKVTAELGRIRERSAKAELGISSDVGTYVRSANDVPPLLAAVEAAMKLADEWAQSGGVWPDVSARLREAIRAALAGEEASDEG